MGGEGIPYAFIGGVALSAWAGPRSTFEVDLAVSIGEARLPRLQERFGQAGFVLDEAFARGFRHRVGGMELIQVRLPESESLLVVDIFMASTPFLQSVVSRRKMVEMGRGPVPVCTAADLILFKLQANRKKDQADLENLLSTQGVPEREYLERWAKTLEVQGRLEAALRGLP